MIKAGVTQRDLASFRRFVDRYERQVGRATGDAMRELAGVAARELADKTQPWGLTATVGKKYAENIAKQVNKAIRRGNVEGIPGSAVVVHDHYRTHGRVDDPAKAPKAQFKRAPVPRPEVQKLIERRVARAGAAKGAWLAAGVDVGMSRSERAHV